MIRTLLFALAIIGAIVTLGPTQADADPGPAAVDYELTSFDTFTAQLTGIGKLDASLPPSPILPPNPIRDLNATFTNNTRFFAADLDRIDDATCRELAEAYNFSAVSGDSIGLFSAIGDLADAHCNPLVVVSFATNTIISFAPTDPY